MTDKERLEQYRICQVRGHQPSNLMAGFWDICKHCGTYYRTETNLVEMSKPEGA